MCVCVCVYSYVCMSERVFVSTCAWVCECMCVHVYLIIVSAATVGSTFLQVAAVRPYLHNVYLTLHAAVTSY